MEWRKVPPPPAPRNRSARTKLAMAPPVLNGPFCAIWARAVGQAAAAGARPKARQTWLSGRNVSRETIIAAAAWTIRRGPVPHLRTIGWRRAALRCTTAHHGTPCAARRAESNDAAITPAPHHRLTEQRRAGRLGRAPARRRRGAGGESCDKRNRRGFARRPPARLSNLVCR